MNAMRPLVPVFAPYAAPAAVPVANDYDTPEFRADVRSWLAPLPVDWDWVEVTSEGVQRVVDAAADAARTRPVVVLNLCDGTEDDGYPGISVVRALEAAGLPATGADSGFYEISTSKLAMKRRFAAAGVSTSPWVEIRKPAIDVARAGLELGWPLFLKPDTSAASVGISQKSVARTLTEAVRQSEALLKGMHGREFDRCGIYAENFLSGREFTVLLQSTGDMQEPVRVYPPCERVFHSALPVEERFLSFERYWEQYDDESPPPPGEPFYRHAPVEASLAAEVSEAARLAYLAVGGSSYARVDLRQQSESGRVCVLEVNANCGLTSDDQSSAGAILGFAGVSLSDFVRCALREAWMRCRPGIPPPL